MTLATLFVHRIRAARHAARQRAPGDVVRALPVRVWTGAGWVREKDWIASHPHESSPSSESDTIEPSSQAVETTDQPAETGATDPERDTTNPEHGTDDTESEGVPNWFASQGECAICLSSFARGDRVRVLPCSHVFHVDEIDGWLLNRRKVVRSFRYLSPYRFLRNILNLLSNVHSAPSAKLMLLIPHRARLRECSQLQFILRTPRVAPLQDQVRVYCMVLRRLALAQVRLPLRP